MDELSPRDRVIALLPFYAGLRLGETGPSPFGSAASAPAGPALPPARRCCSTAAASARGAHDILLAIAAGARLDPGFSGRVLRHTFGTRLIRDGYDLVLVAELMGHARTETTRGYSLPTADDAQAAFNSLPADR